MSRTFLCAVSNLFPENFELGVRTGTWGVERRYRNRITPVRPGDRILFSVAGEFRSIHRVTAGPYDDDVIIWPPKDGDHFPHRVPIGPAEVRGRVPVKTLAPVISFMAGKQWGGTLRGQNGVFNDKLTAADLSLIAQALAISVSEEEPRIQPAESSKLITVAGTRWLPALLDELALLSSLRPWQRLLDPLAGAGERRDGLISRVYADERNTPTLGVLPIDKDPGQTVLSTLYGLSSLKQSNETPDQVRGLIFVPKAEAGFAELLRGVANLNSIPFELEVRLRN